MQGRGAATDIALAELAFRAGRRGPPVGTKRRNTWTISSRLPPKTPGDIAPRLDQFARVRCRCRRPALRSCQMTEQAKAPVLVDRLRRSRSCPPPAASRSASEALAVMARIGSPAKRPSARILRVASRPSISGICMSHLYHVERPRLQHLLNARQPAVGGEGPQASLLNSSAATRGGSARCPPLPADARPCGSLGALHRARRRVGGAPCSPCNACSTESASCLGVTGR